MSKWIPYQRDGCCRQSTLILVNSRGKSLVRVAMRIRGKERCRARKSETGISLCLARVHILVFVAESEAYSRQQCTGVVIIISNAAAMMVTSMLQEKQWMAPK